MPKETFFNLKLEKRQLIEQAALAEFAEFGPKGASLNRLVRGAGIAKGSFYQYFEDMDDVLLHLVFQLGERKVNAIKQALDENANADFFIKLSEIYRASIRFLSELTPQELHFSEQIATAAQMNSAKMKDYRQQTMTSLVRPLVHEAVENGEITVNEDLAYALVSQFTHMFRQYIASIKQTQNPIELFKEGEQFEHAFSQIIAVIKTGLTQSQVQESNNV